MKKQRKISDVATVWKSISGRHRKQEFDAVDKLATDPVGKIDVRKEHEPCAENDDGLTLGQVAHLVARGKALQKGRVKAAIILGSNDLASGPAWEILLELWISEKQKRTFSVGEAAIAASCPATTGLRWVTLLCNERLLSRAPDPHDQRRVNLFLTSEGRRKVQMALEAYEVV